MIRIPAGPWVAAAVGILAYLVLMARTLYQELTGIGFDLRSLI
jgi:hypothetical protein